MPRIIITENVTLGLERCRNFLAEKDLLVTEKAAQTIEKQFARLKTEPESGRLVENYPELRELIISFGHAGYVALYHHSIDTDSVYILAFLHQKEVGYN